MSARLTLSAVNAMPESEFVEVFGGVAEHSPWVAEAAAAARPYASRDDMAAAFGAAILGAAPERQMALLNAHPDLAGRAAVAGELTEASRGEQQGAGLDRLTPAEFARFTSLNAAYRKRFGFPFILAVKGADKQMILAAFETRNANSREEELATALRQVARIVAFRLADRVDG